jgi:methylated-DNA-[protein]-cysteine S-methyltransferase
MKAHQTISYCLFSTAIGRIGIAWSKCGIVRLQLPERNAEAIRSRLRALIIGASETNEIDDIAGPMILRIQKHLDGESQNFDDAPLDLTTVSPFDHRVFQAARSIPAGAIATYGEVARRIGAPHAARAVGQALGRNPIAIIIPCHRVVAAGGKAGGFSAFGGLLIKEKLLLLENAHFPAMAQCQFSINGKEVTRVTR